MIPRTILMTAAVITALAACANPAEGVAQTPLTQPPAERSTPAEQPVEPLSVDWTDEAVQNAEAAMAAQENYDHRDHVPPPYVPPTAEELAAIPNRMTSAELQTAIVRLMDSLQGPDDLEVSAVEAVLGISLPPDTRPAGQRAASIITAHSARVVVDGKTIVYVNLERWKYETVNNLKISADYDTPECWLAAEPILEELEEIGYKKGFIGAPLRPQFITSRDSNKTDYGFSARILVRGKYDNPDDLGNCVLAFKIGGGNE